MKFTAACFDLDGTLIDTGPPHRAAELATIRAFGFDGLADDHPITFGKGVIPGARIVTEHYGLGSADDVLAEYLRQWERIVADGIELLPGAEAAVRSLADAGLRVALVTSGESDYADGFLRISGLADFFSCSVTLENVTRLKPDPQPYSKAAELLGVNPSECVVFEDSQPGFTAALAAGMYCVGVGEIALSVTGDDAPHLATASFEELDLDSLLGR
ncbi:MAG: HAD family phosphatase [Dehalococcoidia bacterium]|jgi:sugar-phosphatase|nr:HAD family phosphatase [Dehalococcoidia bacterium]